MVVGSSIPVATANLLESIQVELPLEAAQLAHLEAELNKRHRWCWAFPHLEAVTAQHHPAKYRHI